jgi:type III pantothenate kinase
MQQVAIDIGNTRTKAGVFRDNTLVHKEIWATWTAADLLSFVQLHHANAVIFSSVAHTPDHLRATLPVHISLTELTHDIPLPFRNLYHTPHTLGKDRLAAVAGAQALWEGQNLLIIDCGTCVKYEALTAEGAYLGGNIAPGAAMRVRAMHHFTQRLPEVPLQFPDQPIGYSTETALQNGALLGMVHEMSGFIRTFAREMKHPAPSASGASASALHVVLTGGDGALFASVLSDYLPTDINILLHHEPDLTLYGLYHILQFSVLSAIP